MADLNSLFNKIDQTCSNIFLLDENLCLSNSLNVINTNVVNLSSSINFIQNTSNYLNKVYTLFASNSSSWIESSSNISANSAIWIQDYNTVTSLSGTWNNEFALYYNTMYEIQDWNTNFTTYTTVDIPNWLNVNFSVSNFAINQIISVYINLYENYYFDLASNFKASYTHDCHVPTGGGVATCNQACGRPSRGCNHHGGRAGNGPCTNAYDGCSVTVTGGSDVSCTCPGYGGRTLNIPSDGNPYNYYVTDRFSVKSVRVRYRYNAGSSTWSNI